jgi:hypothetical protein
MQQVRSLSIVAEIMTEFSRLTGLSPAKAFPPRYLWTDAFAVCNFLALYRQTRNEKYKRFALLLVDQVHNFLGRHRADDSRTGWISGLDDAAGKRHPTKGGLRIGKKLNERSPSERFNDRLEWVRDGQYYHYLTKWMHALDRVSWVTEDPIYNRWAIELAKTAHAAFTYEPSPGSQKRMYWKMSIDLSYPLVPSMGHHDPLDGWITYNQLQATAAKVSNKSSDLDLGTEIADMAVMCQGRDWTTDDPLGIGGLLCDSYRMAQMVVNENFGHVDQLERLLENVLIGLEAYRGRNSLKLPSQHRLAFRELGLSIGLRALERMHGLIEKNPAPFGSPHAVPRATETLLKHLPLAEVIENNWRDPRSRDTQSWIEHRDINMVMLATSLAPDGFLVL